MINEKLMKIVQAVNDSKGESVDITEEYKFISRTKGFCPRPDNEVHAIDMDWDNLYWKYICTAEEFNQCAKEMSAGYGEKGSDMKDNKHPHHDLIVEWAKDTSKQLQGKRKECHAWVKVDMGDIADGENGDCQFRFKPREFIEGHWYPCVDMTRGSFIARWVGDNFRVVSNDKYDTLDAESMNFIGESLGEIKFS